jgi:hypothetical protein
MSNNTIKFTEPISKLAAHHINSLTENQVCDLVYDENFNYTESLKYVKQIKAFCSKVSQCSDDVCLNEQKYRFAKTRSDGRRYVSMGLQNIHKDIRSLLCRDHSVDYDMKNAHPTIFLYLAKKEGISTPFLNNYIKSRDSFLDSNNVDKVHIIKMLNNDNLIKLCITDDLRELGNEILQVKKILYMKNKGTISCGKRYNIKSSVVNHLMCVHGDLLIQRVVDKYDKSNFHAICFDGFLYNKLDSSINIKDLNALTTDYEIKWDTKPLSREILIPEDFHEKAM